MRCWLEASWLEARPVGWKPCISAIVQLTRSRAVSPLPTPAALACRSCSTDRAHITANQRMQFDFQKQPFESWKPVVRFGWKPVSPVTEFTVSVGAPAPSDGAGLMYCTPPPGRRACRPISSKHDTFPCPWPCHQRGKVHGTYSSCVAVGGLSCKR